MASIQKWARGLLRRASWVPLRFPTTGFEVIPATELLGEEQFDEFKTGNYYPVNVGDLFASDKYQVVGKLGFGSTSTVWLARNLQEHDYITLKIFARDHGDTCRDEFKTYQIIDKANPAHPGHRHVRTALDTFTIGRPGGDHQCIVQQPMWDSWKDLLLRNPTGRFSEALLKGAYNISSAPSITYTPSASSSTQTLKPTTSCMPS
ncbi:unnamed protein product [Parascedosporium putredinis]|uniref:non-specific serine/threonine protein kinase n=1 Tax=Parascedosporium putredinis TaxID=1442378 RepID=A0A9P1GZD5_9PEZI|nr:unnamed protein product [Parascedosporium putredinis]CAI7992776.1 unnamed protein product [Parascedosporium putredinis]